MTDSSHFLFSLKEILGDATPVIDVLDIGAMAEGEERYAPLVRNGLARVSAVEPNPIQIDRLRNLRPDIARFLPYVLGDGAPATMHITRHPGCISLYEPDPAVIDLFTSISASEDAGNFRVERKIPVETQRLDDIDPPVAADYIKIDVQGAELDVLRHGTSVLAGVGVLECEVEFVPLYKNQPIFGDVQLFLRDHGFMLHKMIDVGSRCFKPVDYRGNAYAGISQLLWADAIFIRDFTDPDNFPGEMLAKTALVLHDVYASYDLVLLLLAEYDRRNGTATIPRYLKRMGDFPVRERWLLNFKDWI